MVREGGLGINDTVMRVTKSRISATQLKKFQDKKDRKKKLSRLQNETILNQGSENE